MRPGAGSPLGDGLTFIIQADTGHGAGSDYGQSILRLSPTPGTMKVVDSFTPFDFKDQDNIDADIGSTAVTLLPDFPGTAHPHLAVAADKGGNMNLLDQDNLGGVKPRGPNRIIQLVGANSHGPHYNPPDDLDGKVLL